MTRPVGSEWEPLAPGDPVPGDPYEVAQLSRRYSDTAAEILTQAATLRRIAETTWHSEAGDVFASAARECADHLQQVHGRYEAVGSALNDWVDPLQDAQARSLSLLTQARDAHHRAVTAGTSTGTSGTATSGPGSGGSGTPAPDPTQQAAQQAALDAANADLADARRRLHNLLDDVDSRAHHLASRIRDVIDHDGLADSWWDSVKAWVHDNAGWIKTVTEIVSWIATALAVAALFVTGIGVLLVIGVMAVALAGHLLLAATGEGSWLDVILDVVGMVTFGAGAGALRAAEATGEELTAAGTRAASKGARAAFRQEIAQQRATLSRAAADRVTSTAGRRGAFAQLRALQTAERKVGLRAAGDLRGTLKAPAAIWQRLVLGDRVVPQILRNARLTTSLVPAQSALARIAALRTAPLLTTSYLLDLTRHVTDTVGHVTGHPVLPELEAPIGGRW